MNSYALQQTRRGEIATRYVNRNMVRKAFEIELRKHGSAFVRIINGVTGATVDTKEFRRFPRRHLTAKVKTYPSINDRTAAYSEVFFESTK